MYGVNLEKDTFTDSSGQAVNPWQLVTGVDGDGPAAG